MAIVDTDTLVRAVESFCQSAQVAFGSDTSETWELVESQLNQLDAACRETEQAMWADEARELIAHLEAGEQLTAADQQVLRTFLIGDAQDYLAMENNYQDWIGELNRLLSEIGRESEVVSPQTIGRLRGLVKDAVRLVPDIRNYVEEKSRVQRCTLAVDTLDDSARDLLIRILREQLESPTHQSFGATDGTGHRK